MHPIVILTVFLVYTSLLFIIAAITGKRSTNETYFTGNKSSPWLVVAYGMIGSSLSGVTFISIPGEVGNSAFSYLMIVFGYLVGYAIIAQVLLPMYYERNLTSIYTYLGQRFGEVSYKTGSSFFLLSRSIGSSFRVYLVVNVLQVFVFDTWGVPFWINVALFMTLILAYTFRGGIKTIVWTDTLQTTFMLAALAVSVYFISTDLGMGLGTLLKEIADSSYSQILFTDFNDKRFYLKQFISGAFIAIVMTGLDQDMMQKNLTIRKLKDAKNNIYLLSWMLVPVNMLFLILGAALYMYASHMSIPIPAVTDNLFPEIALKHHGSFAGIVFLIGLMAAAYSSADGSLAALTTSFSVDILGLKKDTIKSEESKSRTRKIVHLGFALFLSLLVIIFRQINDQSVITKLFTIAGYTYGPLLGLFTFGLFTKYKIYDRWVPLVAILAPAICYLISVNSEMLFNGYRLGFELLVLNGILTFTGLLLLIDRRQP